ncbi:MAG: hypothetical protein Kow0077_02630 [Anaerolineae bacterium]
MEQPGHHSEELCPVCQVGRLQPRNVTYTQLYGQTLVSVPNTPAHVCDFCHAVEYDAEAVSRVELLVGHSGPPPNRSQARRTGAHPAQTRNVTLRGNHR